MKASLPLFCAVLLFTSGCITPVDELRQSQAALADERAALSSQYRQCLELAANNLKVDCSGYRTALEVLDSRSDWAKRGRGSELS